MKNKAAIFVVFMFLALCLAIIQTGENNKASQTTVPTSQTLQTTASKRQTTEPLTEKETESEETTTETTVQANRTETAPNLTTEADTTAAQSSTVAFFYDDGEPVYITPEEYYTISGIVMNEAGAYYGSYEGRVAVAQCIRNQIIREKKLGHAYDIETIRATYGLHYTKKPSDEVRRAVTDVFYNHIVVTTEPIIAWCATGSASAWHASQVSVCSYGGNTFYKIKERAE